MISLNGQRHGAHIGGLITNAAVADAVQVGRHSLNDRRTAGLLLDRRLVVALAQRHFLEVAIRSGGGVAAVQTDGAVCPGAGQSGLPPIADIGGKT